MLDLAVEDDLLRKNPAASKAVARPALDSGEEVVSWPDETVARLIDAHPALFRPIPVVAAGCGLRAGEIFGLAVEDVDVDQQVVRVRRQVKKLGAEFVYARPKNDRERTVPLPEWVAATLARYVKAHKPRPYALPWEKTTGSLVTVNPLFRWTDDKHIRARGYDELVWKPALAEAGVIPKPSTDKRAADGTRRAERPASISCATTTRAPR